MDVSITKMSSKGQIVIPKEMREDIKEGEKLIVIKNKDQLILKRVKDLDKELKEDLIFAARVEEAWKRHDKGEVTIMDHDDFMKEVKKW